MKKIALSIVAIVGMSSFGFAAGETVPVAVPADQVDENKFYVGFGIAAVSNRDSEVGLDFSNIEDGQDRTGNFTLLAGYDYNDYIGVEGRYTASFADEDQLEMSGWSIFLKPQYIFKDENEENTNFKVYALVGFGGVTIDDIGNDWEVALDDTGFQWGLGASYSLKDVLDGEDVSIFADYTVLARGFEGLYYKEHVEGDVDAFTVGITYKF